MGLFGKKVPPEELAKEWRTKLRGEMRGLDRQIREIERSEAQVKQQIQAAARNGDMYTARTLAVEVARSRKAVERLHTSKAQLNSLIMQIQTNMATLKISGAMRDSTGVVQAMNDAINMPELKEVMRTMSKEFSKAGLIEETVNETLDDALGVEGEDELAEEQVDAIISSIVTGQLSSAGTTGVGIKGRTAAQPEQVEATPAQDQLAGRLAAL